MSVSRKVAVVGILTMMISTFLAARLLAEFEWNPTATIKFGAQVPEQVDYAKSMLGEVVLADDAGHDGKFFFMQAVDPLYLDPGTHARYFDRPTYRAQRMLYPTMAGLGGLLQPTQTAWGLIIVNILALGVGAAATARLAVELGMSAWLGLSFLLNPGMIVALYVDSADIVGLTALVVAVTFAMRDRPLATGIALSLAVLSRETMILAAVGLIVFWHRERSRIPRVLSAPFVVAALWWGYVHWRLPGGVVQDTEAIGWPLQGFIEAFRGWLVTPNSMPDALIGGFLLLAAIWIAIQAMRRPSALGWAVSGFAPLALILSEPVWSEYFDSARALAPVFTAFILITMRNVIVVGSPHAREMNLVEAGLR